MVGSGNYPRSQWPSTCCITLPIDYSPSIVPWNLKQSSLASTLQNTMVTTTLLLNLIAWMFVIELTLMLMTNQFQACWLDRLGIPSSVLANCLYYVNRKANAAAHNLTKLGLTIPFSTFRSMIFLINCKPLYW